MNKTLLILGAGVFGAAVKEIAEETQIFKQIDFFDAEVWRFSKKELIIC